MWNVFEVRLGSKVLFAWCRFEGVPPFTEMILTESDGFTAAEINEGTNVRLGAFLFQVPGDPLDPGPHVAERPYATMAGSSSLG